MEQNAQDVEIEAQAYTLKTSALTPGTYFLQAIDLEGKTTISKLVKM
jgi:hypothetical protein